MSQRKTEAKPLHFVLRIVLSISLLVVTANNASAWQLFESLGLAELEDYVEVTVSHNLEQCEDQEYPLLVELRNNYDRPIESATFHVTGRLPTRSSIIYQDFDPRYYSSDYIVPAGEVHSSCWRFPVENLVDFCDNPADPHCIRSGVERDQAILAKIKKYPLAGC